MTAEGGASEISAQHGAFPTALLEWSGDRAGGVRRLFDDRSGRPGGGVIETPLIRRLGEWAESFREGHRRGPRIVLLVGGPGNGKTEAIERTIRDLDRSLGGNGRLVQELARAFNPVGQKVPRRVTLDASGVLSLPSPLRLEVVQDATTASDGKPAGQLLVSELGAVRAAGEELVYLCCVNRGVLDDALIHAIDTGEENARKLIESVVQAVSLAPNAPACWPLQDHPDIAVWPMDAESLVEPAAKESDQVPAGAILARALNPHMWPETDHCAAGPDCPFCTSRKLLSGKREPEALLRMLRWFELGSGKRWAFRDLFSLVSFLLAGKGTSKRGGDVDPCQWAANLVELDKQADAGMKPTKEISTAIYALAAAQYQHALFPRWDSTSAPTLAQDIKDLGLRDNNTAMGLLYFVQSRKSAYAPATIASLSENLAELLDPALASPDAKVVGWGAPEGVKLREFDARFSRSVQEGLDFAVGYRLLSSVERRLLSRLAKLDEHLAVADVRRKRPGAASRVQRYVRDFASRFSRRSVGARQGIVPDSDILDAFHRVVADAEGSGDELREVAHKVEDLLNNGDHFEVSLTTTFGQPLPPERGRAVLVVPRRNVLPRDPQLDGRPRPSLCFLDVGLGEAFQPIALTYDLFKAVVDLERGLSRASLPRSVVAMLDTTRARMAGAIVRDRTVQDRLKILLGDGLEIGRQRGRFVSSKRVARP